MFPKDYKAVLSEQAIEKAREVESKQLEKQRESAQSLALAKVL